MGFTTFGYPSVAKTREIIQIFQDSGVDIVELGIPFSDPLADGPIIQKSSLVALENKVSVHTVLACLAAWKKEIHIPVAVLTYYNPIFRLGLRRFFQQAQGIIDGIGIADVPLEEADEYRAMARDHGVDTFFFVAPTTEESRARRIAIASTGFVYYVSVSGITGTKTEFSSQTLEHIRHLRGTLKRPLLVGFGINTPDDVRRICSAADGAIVGSAIIQKIDAWYRQGTFRGQLGAFLRTLKDATRTRTHA